MATATRLVALGFSILGAGIALAFAAAVVPFYDAGYKLDGSVLIAGLLPYLLYGMVVALWCGPVTLTSGLLVLFVHAWLVVHERFLDGADYGDGWIYYMTIALTLLVAPLLIAALRRPWPR